MSARPKPNYVPADLMISVWDASDPHGMPIAEGTAAEIAPKLVRGVYTGSVIDDSDTERSVIVCVFETTAIAFYSDSSE